MDEGSSPTIHHLTSGHLLNSQSHPSSEPAGPQSGSVAVSDGTLTKLWDRASDCLAILDPIGTTVWANEAARTAWSASPDDTLVGRPFADVWDPLSRADADRARQRVATAMSASFQGVARSAASRGSTWDVHISSADVPGPTQPLLLVIARDVTEHLRRQASLNEAASFDAMTGLLNRSSFMQRVSSGMAQLQPLTLVVLDVDHLKRTNDTDGHAAGNEVIRHVAARLRAAQSPHVVAARLGGDEFALACFGAVKQPALQSVVDGLCRPVRLDPLTWPCSASAGIAFDAAGVPFDELYHWADAALSTCKATGGGTSRVFDARMREELQKKASIVNLTRRAVTSGNILPYYQPKVDLASGTIVGFEALLRVRFPDASVHTATAVTAALQEADLAAEIDRAMLDGVLADIRSWHKRGVSRPVAVNLSNGDVRQRGFAQSFLAALSLARVAPQCIEAEITESVLLEGTDSAAEETLLTLSAAGVSIALDDFGTGYASLSHLKRFPIDVIKIDRQFIQNLPTDTGDQAIVRAMIGLAQTLGMNVVAEGIERRDQAEFLRAEGCRTGQGFLFSPAVAQLEAHEMATRGTAAHLGHLHRDAEPRSE